MSRSPDLLETRLLETTLRARRERGEKSLVPYLMSGFPDRRSFLDLAKAVLAEGADALEIGLPFSDPLADGPVIQAAGQRALEAGVDLRSTLEDVAKLRATTDAPLVLMSYLNPLRQKGVAHTVRACRRAGLCGLIVPDRDLDDDEEVLAPTRDGGLACVPLVAPTSPDARIAALCRRGSGFVYLVSLTGVTGASTGRSLEIDAYVRRVRRHTELPLCVGFGISGERQAAQAVREADGVIVGSALLEPFLGEGRTKRARGAARDELLRRLRSVRKGLGRRS